ncbi:MAG TPA: 50S ribosomal protein L11 methyltransferase [Solirubrobacteraceae bacterium]|nr:50S ribosomal protein L11 methyltransferase [Solirubrobacteraceae bacterium]
MDLVEEIVPLRDRELAVLRPRDSEALIDEEAFARDERMPYWAELWPSGIALARMVAARSLRGRRVVELGCGGLALPSIAAALAGARVLATDWEEEALALARRNAERNGAEIETATCAWERPEGLVDRGPWDLVLAADVLYERRHVAPLAALLPRLVAERGEVWLADPNRPPMGEFLDTVGRALTVRSSGERDPPGVGIHVLRRAG